MTIFKVKFTKFSFKNVFAYFNSMYKYKYMIKFVKMKL